VDAPKVTLTNPDKVLYPATSTTKAEVFDYYTKIAPYLVPHLIRRPITRRVWPNGVDGTTFFSKEAARGVPEWIYKVPIDHKSGSKDYVLLDSPDAIAWNAQQAGLEIHVPQWRFAPVSVNQNIPKLPPEQLLPDRLVIDLDPGEGVPLSQCAEVALRAREILRDIGLESYPVTSGSKGIHLYAPLAGFQNKGKALNADEVSALAKEIAKLLEAEEPDKVISTMSKASRVGKVLVDWSQNNGKKTTIAPYSLRGQEMPYVAAPRTWEEIAAPDLKQLTYKEVLERVKKHGDLLIGLLEPDNPNLTQKKKAATPLSSAQDVGGGAASKSTRHPAARAAGSQDLLRLENNAEATSYSPMLASMPSAQELQMLEAEGRKDDPKWGFEIKWDGYRAIAVVAEVDGEPEVTLWSRNGQNYTETYSELGELKKLAKGPYPVVLDGEIVAFDTTGRPNFNKLQQHQQKKAPTITFQCFDILQQGKKDLTKLPFTQRREILEEVLTPKGDIHISPLIPYDDAMRLSKAYDLEGVMAKRLTAKYQPGIRSKDWLKIKHLQTNEFIVVGYTPLHAGEPNESADSIGSLLLAQPISSGQRCVGRVGTGFTQAQRREIFDKLQNLVTKEKPKSLTGVTKTEAKHINWVKPELKTKIEYAEWTTNASDPDARLRHPRWKGWVWEG